jgi:hypothetical protein
MSGLAVVRSGMHGFSVAACFETMATMSDGPIVARHC